MASDDMQGEAVSQDDLVLYRCTECGKVSVSLGWLHGNHMHIHHGWGPRGIIPDPRTFGNFNAHMEYTEVLRVTGMEQTTLDEVEVRG